MKLSTGRVAFPIEFDNGDKEVIYFNPNDVELAERVKAMQANLAKKADEIDKAQGADEEKADYLAMFEALNKAIKEEIDKAFNSEISKAVFKYCSPMSVVDGRFYAELFFEEVAKAMKTEHEKSQKKINKHIGKYQK